MNLYFISGLGADKRAFSRLDFPKDWKIIYLDWMDPLSSETLEEYALRFSKKIDPNIPFILIGYSFGGILASEMLEFLNPLNTIIISSIASRKELPLIYRIAGNLNLHKLLPEKASNQANFLTYYMFGIKTEKDRSLLNEILSTTDTKFSVWALHQILKWKRKHINPRLIRIHGSGDRLLPIQGFVPDYLIDQGGHFMVADRSEEILKILKKEILKFSPSKII